MKILPLTVLGIGIFCFWAFLLPHHLSYQESVQIFVYDWSELATALGSPGGFAALVGSFLTQFSFIPVLGALIMTLVSMLLWWLVRKFSRSGALVSCIPALMMNAYMVNIDCTMAMPVAILLVLICALLVCNTMVGEMLAVAALYWLVGPLAMLYPLLLLFRQKCFKPLPTLALALLLPLLSSLIVKEMSVLRLYEGMHYNHARDTLAPHLFFLPASLVVLSIPYSENFRRKWYFSATLLALCAVIIYLSWDEKTLELERIYTYSDLAEKEEWGSILELSNKSVLKDLPSITCHNLALAKTGNLGSYLFSTPQQGPQGLIPAYESGYLSMVIGFNALKHSGLLQTAMHYAFETNMAYPDKKPSARQIKHLYQINAMNGSPAAAHYKAILNRTLFYRGLGTPALAPQAELEPLLLNDSDDYSKQTMLRALMEAGMGTDISLDYILCFDLLCKDLDSFETDFAAYWPKDKGVPQNYQEALLMPYFKTRDNSVLNRPGVSEEVRARLGLFVKSLSERRPDKYMQQHFGNTYWLYHAKK